MRATLKGTLLGALLAFVIMTGVAEQPGVGAQRAHGAGSGIATDVGLIALQAPNANGQHLVILIDPRQRSMGTYQVNVETGQIALRSVRNLQWDLQMDEFNGSEPSPMKIQALLESR